MWVLKVGLAFLTLFQTGQRRDLLVADFEGKDYGGWTVTGTAFGSGPAHGTLPGQMPVTGYLGKGLVNSFNGGDAATGTLTSPPFQIQRPYINFLVGGGKDEKRTCMNLLMDGKIVRVATGTNDRPGGSEALKWHFWDVKDLVGKVASIQIVDQATGGWGHINVDQIVQSDRKREALRMKREIEISKQYLLLPVKNGAPKIRVRYDVDGKWVREFTVELADSEPDFWAFSDVTEYKGKKLSVSATETATTDLLLGIRQSDDLVGASTMYQETLRPKFHFSSRVGWLNDPNGLVYHEGEYHLFYQHNPFGWGWDNMHWGHAVSPDLMHWRELPVAIYPHQWDDWVFSGSAIIDKDNTSGFRTGTDDVMVAAYTSTGRGECIAYSNDKGRTFTDYSGNPVVKHSGRDPKVIWYSPGKHWVIAVYDELEGKQWIAFYNSTDLKAWTFQSRIEGFFECPELFEIPVVGQPGETRWIVYAADGQYRIGTFDGKTFHPETEKVPIQFGNIFYASQTYNGMKDGRRVQVAWGRSDTPGMPFNQCMLFPTELTLRRTPEGLRLFVNPVREIVDLHTVKHLIKPLELGSEPMLLPGIKGELVDLRVEFSIEDAKQFGVAFHGSPLTYDVAKHELEFRGCHAPMELQDGKIELRVLIDRSTVEIYANGGKVYMPVGGINIGPANLSLFAHGGKVRVNSLEAHDLKPSMVRQPGH